MIKLLIRLQKLYNSMILDSVFSDAITKNSYHLIVDRYDAARKIIDYSDSNYAYFSKKVSLIVKSIRRTLRKI